MATETEMRRAGIHLPTGSDYMNEGDDAITANASVLWERIEGARFDRTASALGSSSDLDTIANGTYSIWAGATAETLGLPNATAGTFQSFQWGSSAGVQLWMPRVFSGVQLWLRNKLSGGWTDWAQPGVDDDAEIPLPVVPPASGYKTLPLSVTRGNGGGGRAAAEGTVRIPLTYNADITRWRVHIVDGNPRFNLRKPTGFRIASMKFGERNGLAITGAETIMSGATNPSGSRDGLTSPWVSRPLSGENFLQVSYDQTSETPVSLVGGCYVNSSPTAGDSATGFSRSVTCPFDIWIEAETSANTPAIAVLGDSNSVGVGTRLPVHDSYLSVYCRKIGALPVHYGHSGDTLARFEDPDQDKWNRWRDLSPVDAVIQMLGSNDIAGSPSIGEMVRRYQVVTDIARQKVSPVVHVGLLKPRTSGSSSYQALRLQYNEFLSSLPSPARAVHDLSSPVANAADDAILSEYDSDGTHMTTAGHQALAAAITQPIVEPKPSGPYDSGMRDITGLVPDLELWQYPGSDQLHRAQRIGSQVDVTLYNLSYQGEESGAITVLRLPPEFRPPQSVFIRTFRDARAVVQQDGQVRIYDPGSTLDYMNWSFLSRNDPRPGQEPGSPA